MAGTMYTERHCRTRQKILKILIQTKFFFNGKAILSFCTPQNAPWLYYYYYYLKKYSTYSTFNIINIDSYDNRG